MSEPSPLLRLLREIIAAEGPIGVDRFMALALAHPVHGYYTTRDPLGRDGDFTTAPEISQMFGEMVGLWCATVHAAMGAPPLLRLVELGPGRGTLMADLLRAASTVPGFRAAAEVHLVEVSPVLRARQAEALAGAPCPVAWHAGIDALPPGPAIVVGNEFLDALPVRQHVRTPRGWCERLVGLSEAGALCFGLAAEAEPRFARPAPPGTVLETADAARAVVRRLCARLAADGGAALFVDYGAAGPGTGDTLQAVRDHRFADPLAHPGEADLTTHVDFAAIRSAGIAGGARAHGPVTQGDFLGALGIQARAAALAARNPGRAATVEAALARLTGPGDAARPGMGALFKAIAFTAPGLPAPPGFEQAPG